MGLETIYQANPIIGVIAYALCFWFLWSVTSEIWKDKKK